MSKQNIKEGIVKGKTGTAIEYGIRGKSQKNIVQYHGSSSGAIKYGIQGSSKSAISHGLQSPKSDFTQPENLGRGKQEE